MKIKLRSKAGAGGSHIRTQVFMTSGLLDETYQLTGELCTDMGQWQLFGAALLLGAERTDGQLEVICEGDEDVVLRSKEELDGK